MTSRKTDRQTSIAIRFIKSVANLVQIIVTITAISIASLSSVRMSMFVYECGVVVAIDLHTIGYTILITSVKPFSMYVPVDQLWITINALSIMA
eukprot:scaffold79756_cov43-Prasinocladus_malaysianus.AAC.1